MSDVVDGDLSSYWKGIGVPFLLLKWIFEFSIGFKEDSCMSNTNICISSAFTALLEVPSLHSVLESVMTLQISYTNNSLNQNKLHGYYISPK